MKNRIFQLLAVLGAALISVISCSVFSDTGGGTYLVFSSSSRAADARTERLTNITLSGSHRGASEQTLGHWQSWQDASGARIEVDSGEWNFTLSATLDETEYTAETSLDVEAGKENALSFTFRNASETEESPETFTVSFDTDGGSEIESQSVESGKTASEPTEPTKDGFAFAGWYTDAEFGTEFDFGTAITADTTFYAKWQMAQIGTKSAPNAVGDIVFSDGSATAYSEDLELTDEQKAAAVAVIFYNGTANDILGEKRLGIGLGQANLAWCIAEAKGNNNNISAIACLPNPRGEGAASNSNVSFSNGDTDGSDNWAALCEAVDDEDTLDNYPAWKWVNAYAANNSLSGDYASGWYFPTIAELTMLYRAVKAAGSVINAALEAAGGTSIADAGYWSSSQHSTLALLAFCLRDDGLMGDNKTETRTVCAIRAF